MVSTYAYKNKQGMCECVLVIGQSQWIISRLFALSCNVGSVQGWSYVLHCYYRALSKRSAEWLQDLRWGVGMINTLYRGEGNSFSFHETIHAKDSFLNISVRIAVPDIVLTTIVPVPTTSVMFCLGGCSTFSSMTAGSEREAP